MGRSRAGGISGLVELIRQHGEALDADLQHHYQLSLADVVAGRLTLRRLRGLIAGLPGDGTAMWRAGRRNMPKDVKGSPPPADFWTPQLDMLATIADELAVLIWMKTKDAAKGQNYPKPISRPGVSVAARARFGTPMTIEEFKKARQSAAGAADGDDPQGYPVGEPEGAEASEGDTPGG